MIYKTSIYDASHKDTQGSQFQKIPRTLAVFKDHKVAGYVKGTKHHGVSFDEYIKFDRQHNVYMLSKVDKIFFELDKNCIKSTSQIGTESWIIAQNKFYEDSFRNRINKPKIKEISGLETISSQIALCTSDVVLFDNVYVFPWKDYSISSPRMVMSANFLAHVGLIPIKIASFFTGLTLELVYKYLLGEKRTSTQQKEIDYTNTSPVTQGVETIDVLLKLTLRDKSMYENLKGKTNNLKEKFLVAIGMLHLSNSKGILFHFENDGYVLRDLDVVMNKEKVANEIVKYTSIERNLKSLTTKTKKVTDRFC